MKNIQNKFKRSLLAVAMSLALGSVVVQAGKDSVDMGSSSLSYASSGSNLTLSVAGSGMDVVTVYGDSSINWNLPANIADGSYRYELSVVTPGADDKEESTSVQRVNGTFEVSNGLIEVAPESSEAPEEAGPTPATEDVSARNKSTFEEVAISVLNFLVPTAEAANLTADNPSYPYVIYRTGGNSRWLQQVLEPIAGLDSRALRTYSYGTAKTHALIRYNANFHTLNDANFWAVLTAGSGANYGGVGPTYLSLHKNATNSFITNSSGDIGLADNSVYINKSANRIGVGTTTPTHELELKSTDPTILLDDTHGTKWYLNEYTGKQYFNISHKKGSNPIVSPFWIHENAKADALRLLASGVNIAGDSNSSTLKLGIGTSSPENAIHIKRNGANIKIEDNSAATAKRFQIQMRNKGGTGFKMTDTSVAGREWQFATLSNGSFTASYLDSGGSEFQILNNGRVTMGPGATTNFNLVPGGNLYIPNGYVYAVGHISTSSRESKEKFENVDSREVLSKLKEMEITEWQYKNKEAKGRHIGPMAEDFYKMFELGPDNKHVSATDIASVALIASKELQKENTKLKQELKQQTEALKVDNNNLLKRLASLEKLVTKLASSGTNLSREGDKVALK